MDLIENNELEGTRKEAVEAQFAVIFQNWSGRAEDHRNEASQSHFCDLTPRTPHYETGAICAAL